MTNQGSVFTCREGVSFQLPLTDRATNGVASIRTSMTT
jgi:hypothetical protein